MILGRSRLLRPPSDAGADSEASSDDDERWHEEEEEEYDDWDEDEF